MAVKVDIIDGNKGRLTFAGWEFERIATVTGCGGDGHAKIYTASTAAGMPALGSVHPTVAYCYLLEKNADSVDSETVRFRLLYRKPNRNISTPQIDTVEVGGTLSQKETNRDVNGNVMTVGYTFPSDHPIENYRSQQKIQSGLINKLIPEHSIVISRLEYANPSARAKEYVGTVNGGAWSLDMSAAARTWLCTGIVGRSPDAGATYTVTYSFQYRGDNWDGTMLFTDPATGKPPPEEGDPSDWVESTYQMYAMMNFNNLGL